MIVECTTEKNFFNQAMYTQLPCNSCVFFSWLLLAYQVPWSSLLPFAVPSPEYHRHSITAIHTSSWPQKLHYLMDNMKEIREINANQPQVKFLPKNNTVAVYCFLLLHLTTHVHPVVTSTSGGCTMRFTCKAHTVRSMSK